MIAGTQVSTSLIVLSIVLIGLAGCIPPSTQPAEPPTPTLAPGWETFSNQGQCSYAINHPSAMDGTSQGTYSWNLSPTFTEPVGLVPNFVYISVIPDGFQGGPGSQEPRAAHDGGHHDVHIGMLHQPLDRPFAGHELGSSRQG